MYRSCQNKSGILVGTKLIPVFFSCQNKSGIFQPENKYGIFLSGKNNSGIFHARKINTVFIFALDSRWTAGGQGRWTEWTEVCPLGQKKVE